MARLRRGRGRRGGRQANPRVDQARDSGASGRDEANPSDTEAGNRNGHDCAEHSRVGQSQRADQSQAGAGPPLAVAEEPAALLLKELEVPSIHVRRADPVLPPRPGYGAARTPCVVRANRFHGRRVDDEDLKSLHQYKVTISPEPTPKGACREVVTKLVAENQHTELGGRFPAYDGRDSLFTAGALPFGTKGFEVTIYAGGDKRMETNHATGISLLQLRMLLAGYPTTEIPLQALHILETMLSDISFNQRNGTKRVPIGTKDHRLEILAWKGLYQTITSTKDSLSLISDMSLSAFVQPLLLIDSIQKTLKIIVVDRNLTEPEYDKLLKSLMGVKIVVTHIGNKHHRYIIIGLSVKPTTDLSFVSLIGPTKIVIDHFRERYMLDLKYKSLPCIDVGGEQKPISLHIEVCKIVPGQCYKKHLEGNQVSTLRKSAAIQPEPEQSSRQVVDCKRTKSPNEFGVEVNDNITTTLDARVLLNNRRIPIGTVDHMLGILAWKGLYQTIVSAKDGLSLISNMSLSVSVEPLPLIDSVQKTLKIDIMDRNLTEPEYDKILKALISSESHHFREKYSLDLKYKSLPFINVGSEKKTIYLPIEIYKIVLRLYYQKRLEGSQVSTLRKSAAIHPEQSSTQESLDQCQITYGVTSAKKAEDLCLKEKKKGEHENVPRKKHRILEAQREMLEDENEDDKEAKNQIKIMRKVVKPYTFSTSYRQWIVYLVIIFLSARINVVFSMDHNAKYERFCPASLAAGRVSLLRSSRKKKKERFCPASTFDYNANPGRFCLASTLDYNANPKRFCPASSTNYDANFGRFCPASHGQSKRVIPTDDWILTSKDEKEVHSKNKTGCTIQSGPQKVGSAIGAFLSILINLGPMKTIFAIANVGSDRRKLLCNSSIFLAISNLSWIFNMSTEECKNTLSFVSVLIGFALNGYFSWFYWQRKYAAFSVASGIAIIVSMIPSLIIYLWIGPQFLRIGHESSISRIIVYTVIGIIGLVSTLKGIQYRMELKEDQFSVYQFIVAAVAFLGTLSSLCSSTLEYRLLWYKIAIGVLCGSRLFEASEQIYYYFRGPAPRQINANDENDTSVPLLQHGPEVDVDVARGERNMVTMHGPTPALQFDSVVVPSNDNSFDQTSLELMGDCSSSGEFKESKESKSEHSHECEASQIRVPVEEDERNGVQKRLTSSHQIDEDMMQTMDEAQKKDCNEIAEGVKNTAGANTSTKND